MKCYSFYYGTDPNDPKQWIHFDLKIPAINIKSGMAMFYFYDTMMRAYRNKPLKRIEFDLPNRSYINSFIRRVIEYERLYTPHRGKTIHQYKKIKIYQPNEVALMF